MFDIMRKDVSIGDTLRLHLMNSNEKPEGKVIAIGENFVRLENTDGTRSRFLDKLIGGWDIIKKRRNRNFRPVFKDDTNSRWTPRPVPLMNYSSEVEEVAAMIKIEEYDKAMQELDKYLQKPNLGKDEESKKKFLHMKAQLFSILGDPDSSENVYKDLIRFYEEEDLFLFLSDKGDLSRLYTELAKLQAEKQEKPSALASAHRAIQYDNNNTDAQAILDELRYDGEAKPAPAAIERVKHDTIGKEKITTLIKKGEKDKAMEELDEYLQKSDMDEKDRRIFLLMKARLYSTWDLDRAENTYWELIRFYEKGNRLLFDNEELSLLYTELAELQEEKGDIVSAMASLDIAILFDDSNIDAEYLKESILDDLGYGGGESYDSDESYDSGENQKSDREKVVIITVPMKQPHEVSPITYPVDGNKAIEYGKPVRCPLNSVLAKTMKKGEQVRVIYITTRSENSECEQNKKNFIDEIEGINAEIGAVLSYDTVETDFSPTKQIYNKLLTDLTEKIPQNAEIFTDVTFGSKPKILSLLCALRFVEEFRNAIVQYIVYGQAEHPMLFDITSLFYLFKLIGTMGTADAETASKMLKDFFAI